MIKLDKETSSKQSALGVGAHRGEFSSWNIGEVKRTIQKYMRQVRRQRARGQNWKTFFTIMLQRCWARDFLQITDLSFRPLFASSSSELRVTESDPCESDCRTP